MERRRFFKKMLAIIGVSLTAGTAYAYHSSKIEVTRLTISRTDYHQKLRIVAISDVHAPGCGISFSELISLVNHESPDIFVLAGDIIDKSGYEDLVANFASVEAGFAKLAVLGNWEYHAKLGLKRLEKAYAKAGVLLLVNGDVKISGLRVTGLDDFLLGYPNLQILKKVSQCTEPQLVISHCPRIFDSLPSFTSSSLLVLSGHTHGGQIAPFGIPFLTPNGSGSYVQGWYRKGEYSMYVMRGIGTTSGIPLRIGARPEILSLDLVRA